LVEFSGSIVIFAPTETLLEAIVLPFISKITDRILDAPESRLKILCILFLFNPMF